MVQKFLLIAVVLVGNFLILFPVRAQQVDVLSNIPALNPFCWKKKDCIEARRGYVLGDPSNEELAKGGFITGNSVAPCVGGEGDDQWGKCLPAGQTKTAISFGGQDRFANIGEFILTMYKYLMTMASIVAVIVIIVAGMQWVTSGGNSETISGAKHRIGGAVIGLFIAYMSYFILYTVNPAIVNFRLPQTWLIKPQHLIPHYCKQVPGAQDGKLKFLYFAGASEQNKPAQLSGNENFDLTYGPQKDTDGNPVFMCGRRFLAEDGGTQTCVGDICPSGVESRQTCAQGLKKGSPTACRPGELLIHYFIDYTYDLEEQLKLAGGKVSKNILISGSLEREWLFENQVVWGVCETDQYIYLPQDRNKRYPMSRYLANDGEGKTWRDGKEAFVEKELNGEYYEYLISFSKLADWENMGWNCKQGGKLVGYLIRNETAAQQALWEDIGDILTLTSPQHYPNLNIGYSNRTGQAVFGTMSKDVGFNLHDYSNYIPIDKLRDGGLRLEVGITIGKYLRMMQKSYENPQTFIKSLKGEIYLPIEPDPLFD